MQYLAMLYGKESEMSMPGTPEWEQDMAGYMRFGEKNHQAIVAGEALLGSDQTVTVRTADAGAPVVTDGPYLETAEVVGGFYVLDAPDLDAAIALATEIPIVNKGSVELRPVVMWNGENYTTASDPGSRYLAVIVDEPLSHGVPGTPEWQEGAEKHGKFIAAAGDAVIGGAALHPTTTATTVRVRGDEVLVTDGPFAETNEIVGGFYLLRGPNRDAVADLAAGIPVSDRGAIELWRVMDLG
jgi:hypothetical protein